MKAKIQILLLIALSLTLLDSCIQDPPVPIPDLNPGTEEGGEMLIYEMNDVISFTSELIGGTDDPRFKNFYREYDFFDNGSIDLTLTGDNISGGFFGPPNLFVRLRFNGEALRNSYNQVSNDIFNFPSELVWLPVDALTGGSMPNGNWAPTNTDFSLISESRVEGVASWQVGSYAPEGLSYIAVRILIGGDYHYGWIELVTTDVSDDDLNDFILISRFANSETPGLRVRMGAE